MNVVELHEIRRILSFVVLISGLWLVASLLLQVAFLLRGSDRRLVSVPRVVHLALLSVIAAVSAPKPVAATPAAGQATVAPSHDESGADWTNMALVGSVAGNALAVGVYVRRTLARLRTERFGSGRQIAPEGTKFEVDVGSVPDQSDWMIIVKVLGPPVVETRAGTRIAFNRGKAQELLVWMTEHRQTSTRSGARTALWEEDVQDSTFSNIVSELRRALNSALPLDDGEWIPRTFTDELHLHCAVVTDAEILENALNRFLRDPDQSPDELRMALASVGNLPFWGANYPWADGEGITTSHVMKVVKAAVVLGEYAIEHDDAGLLFMATERGLRVLPGHEELIALRMKGHARVGNRAAIKYEWESYVRAIEADSWAGASPSTALEHLAHELSRAG